MYEGNSVNMPHMDIKRKTCDIRTWKKRLFLDVTILHQHLYTCPIALPVRRNPQHRSLLTVVSTVASVAISAGRPSPASSATFERP
jgi:hypothetical protein